MFRTGAFIYVSNWIHAVMQLKNFCPKESRSPALRDRQTALTPCNCSTGISPLFHDLWETVSIYTHPHRKMHSSLVHMLFWGNSGSEDTLLNSFCCVTVSPDQYLAQEVLTRSEGCFLCPLAGEWGLPGVWLTLMHLPFFLFPPISVFLYQLF